MKTASIRKTLAVGLLLAWTGGLALADERSKKELRDASRRICDAAHAAASAQSHTRPRIISPVSEVMLGHDQARQFEQNNPVRADARLERIGRMVAEHSDRRTMNFSFQALRKKEPLNAFSLLGGHIYVSSGFLEQDAFTDHELAAILGHEIAHAAFRDVPQEHLESWFLSYHAQALCDEPTDPRIVVGAVEALEQRLGHDHHAQELSADQYGSLYAVRAGFHFSGGVTVLEKLADLRDEQGGFGNRPGTMPTHPPFAVRSAQLMKTRDRLVQVALDFRFGNEAMDDRDFERAIKIFDSILGVFPESHNARLNLASALHGRYRYLRKVTNPAPELQLAAAIEAGTIVRLMRNDVIIDEPLLLQRAELHYRTILEEEPENPMARNNLAAALFDTQDVDAAITELELLAERGHVAPTTKKNLGVCYAVKSRASQENDLAVWQDRAMEFLESYLQDVPGDRDVIALLEKLTLERAGVSSPVKGTLPK